MGSRSPFVSDTCKIWTQQYFAQNTVPAKLVLFCEKSRWTVGILNDSYVWGPRLAEIRRHCSNAFAGDEVSPVRYILCDITLGPWRLGGINNPERVRDSIMVHRPRTKFKIARKTKRCPKCGKIVRDLARCKVCHKLLKK